MDEQDRERSFQHGGGAPQQPPNQPPGYGQGPQPPPGYGQGPPWPGYGPPPSYQDPYERWRRDDRTWAMLCHLAAFAGSVVPLGHIVGPLIVWLLKKNDYPLTDDQGKQSLNFQISITLYSVLCIPLVFLLIGIPLIVALWILNIVFIIMAALRANKGDAYRYPLAIPFIK